MQATQVHPRAGLHPSPSSNQPLHPDNIWTSPTISASNSQEQLGPRHTILMPRHGGQQGLCVHPSCYQDSHVMAITNHPHQLKLMPSPTGWLSNLGPHPQTAKE
ncbi:hypothetical protein SLA2020_264410 [Shorea laevis]